MYPSSFFDAWVALLYASFDLVAVSLVLVVASVQVVVSLVPLEPESLLSPPYEPLLLPHESEEESEEESEPEYEDESEEPELELDQEFPEDDTSEEL